MLEKNMTKLKKVLHSFAGALILTLAVLILTSLPVRAESKEIIFVGDSRTVGMRAAVTSVWDDDYNNLRDQYGVWVAKCGKNHLWFENTAVYKMLPYINEGNKDLVILMGCNDMPYTSYGNSYINYIKNNASTFAEKNINVYYVSVNPVGHKLGGTEETYYNDNGVAQFTNKGTVEVFNNYMKANLPSNVTYIDTYSMLLSEGYTTVDGLHYSDETYKKIFNKIVDTLAAVNNTEGMAGFISSKVFDYDYYVNNYDDVAAYAGTSGDAASKALAFDYFLNTGLAKGEQASAFFNINDYMELNPDVVATYGNDPLACVKHYIDTGYAAGNEQTLKEEHATIYYAPYYLSKYEELQTLYGKGDGDANWTGLLTHFLRYSIKDGLQASANFNVNAYKNNYKDLREEYGTDLQKYYWHYAYYGAKEGLNATDFLEFEGVTVQDGVDYSAVYDYNYFRTRYPDVAEAFGDDDVATLANFVRWGMEGARQGNEEFNVDIYKANYPQLVTTYGSNLAGYYLHYIRWGKAAGLIANERIDAEPVTVQDGIDYSAVYNFEYFQTKYPDVKAAFGDDDVATLANFVRWGMEGGRQGSEEFNVNIYKKNYPELVDVYGDNLQGYYMHYIWWGKAAGLVANEELEYQPVTVQDGVDYSAVYNFEYFQTKYPDVKAAFGDDDVATLANFVRWGIASGRQGSEEFNVDIYKTNYPQLVTTYGSNMMGYYLHYIRWGKAGGLNAREVLEKDPVTEQDGVDYSPVYDYEYFRTKYPDVKAAFGDDDVATLANFVRWGMEGGRQGSEEFNVEIYKQNYPELVDVYGTNLPGYYLHYIRWGKAAGLNGATLLNQVTTASEGDETVEDSSVQTDSSVQDASVVTSSDTADQSKTDQETDKQAEEEKALTEEQTSKAEETETAKDQTDSVSTTSESAKDETLAVSSTSETVAEDVNRFAIGQTGLELTGLDTDKGSFKNYAIDENYDQLWSDGNRKPAYMEYRIDQDGQEVCLSVERYALDECDSLDKYLEKKGLTYDESCLQTEKVGKISLQYYQAEGQNPIIWITDSDKAYICSLTGLDQTPDVASFLAYFKEVE